MRDRNGFTLIELLITLGIFSVVTGLVMVNFRVGQQGDELRIASRLVESRIRRAQTAAIAGETIFVCKGGTDALKVCPSGDSADCAGGTCQRDIPPGYGVHFSLGADAGSMVYFADTDGDKIFRPREEIHVFSVTSGAFVTVSSIFPEQDTMLDIVFVPPKPSVFFNGERTPGIATVRLQHETTGATRDVTLNRISGQVSTE